MSVGLSHWLSLVLLGAWHGLNPAMGWLFAVALGLQQRSRGAVFRALVPIAVGHALAIGLVVFVLFVLGTAVPVGWLQLGGAAILLGLDGDCGERGIRSGLECVSVSGISPVGLGSWRAHMVLE